MSPSRSNLGWPDLLLVLSALVWATSYGVTQTALHWVPVAVLLALRFGLASLLLAPAWLRLRLPRADWARVAGLGGLVLLTLTLECWGVLHTSASHAALLISLCLVFTPLAEWAWLGRRPRILEAVACVASLTGVVLLTAGGGLHLQLGDGLILGAALSRTALGVLTRQQMLRRPLPALALTGVQSGVVALGALLAIWLIPGQAVALPGLTQASGLWLAIAWLVIGCTVFATGAQNLGARYRSATRVALLSGCEPAFGAVFAALWLDDRLGYWGWSGAALLVGAALLAVLPTPTLFSARRALQATDAGTG
ncbi:EamA-like transporter family protein [Pseudoxanthomonas sp. GM95]|uniref:DMT family transporter n=1 Tax=Pseudoxanthomonas sp. GM95 TaxID=1881043 RepID=UPI0008B83A5F|nr:DMT family transporter [Pseudoxanthomonas sp. GM95]SEL67327.1 EamA-like transporter family protein [Pseudoxanthomonas sp. GM95]